MPLGVIQDILTKSPEIGTVNFLFIRSIISLGFSLTIYLLSWFSLKGSIAKKMGPQGYLWVKTPDSAAGLRVDSPWISLCHPWLRERVDNPWNVRSSHTTGFLH